MPNPEDVASISPVIKALLVKFSRNNGVTYDMTPSDRQIKKMMAMKRADGEITIFLIPVCIGIIQKVHLEQQTGLGRSLCEALL